MKKIFFEESIQILLFLAIFHAFFPDFYEEYYILVFNAVAFFLWFPDYINLRQGKLSEERKLYYLEANSIDNDMIKTYLTGIGIAQVIIVVNLLIFYKLKTIMEIPNLIEITLYGIVGILLIIYFKILNKKCKKNSNKFK